jgi:hypothetical protein
MFIPYSHYDGPAHGDGNKKPPGGGYIQQVSILSVNDK